MLNILKKSKKIKSLKLAIKSKVSNEIPVFYYTKVPNFGDILNVYIVEKLSKKRVKAITPDDYLNKHYVVIGSVLTSATKDSIVWGTGIMFKGTKVKVPPKKVCAVRGPRTRELLSKSGIHCPEVYGDPALLLPKLYSPKVSKKFKIGVIPHYVDKNNTWVRSLSDNPEIKVIDIQNTDVEAFVDELLECEHIISSSLHGVIVADAYGIPALWAELSNKVAGNGFKFLDYFESVNRDPSKAKLEQFSTDTNEILRSFDQYSIKIDLDKLIKACPFNRLL